jgi:hypothetical protein
MEITIETDINEIFRLLRKHFTYKLELVKEYTGNKLDEDDLIQHGFKGGRSIQHPLKNNVELLSYIDSVFEET